VVTFDSDANPSCRDAFINRATTESIGQLLVKMASGQITGKEGDKFKAGKLGDYIIGKDGEIVLGPPTEFTAGNIDQFNF
jgi:hypothetical protein